MTEKAKVLKIKETLMILEKLIERIEFDKEKNIKIKFIFQNYPNVRMK